MKILGVHPGPLMYTKIFLRLEPLGLELVAAAARAAGHEVRLIDLQVETPPRPFCVSPGAGGRTSSPFRAIIWPTFRRSSTSRRRRRRVLPSVVDLRRRAQRLVCRRRRSSNTARARSIACCAARARPGCRRCSPRSRPAAISPRVPGAVTAGGEGPPPGFVHSLDDAVAGARPAAAPAQIFSRRARPVRLDRVLARLSRGIARSAAPGPFTAAPIGW